jgi:hypothetical protein
MAIGRISGSVLKSNLTRNGTDLAFETNLLYLDVTNARIGIGTSEPSTALQVAGTIASTGLTVDTNTLHVDSANNRVGIGTASPAYQVEIENTGSNALLVLDRTDGAACFIEGQATRSAFGSVGATPLALAYNSAAVVTIGANGAITVNPDGDGFTFPTTDGTAGQVLATDGEGNVSFTDLSLGDLTVIGSTITTPSNADLTLDPGGTGRVVVNSELVTNIISSDDSSAIRINDSIDMAGNIVPVADNTYSLGTASSKWSALHVSGSTIFLGNLQLKDTGSNSLTVLQSDGSTQANLEIANVLTVVGDDSTGTSLNTGETFKFAGTGGISTSVSGDTLTVDGSAISTSSISEGNSSVTVADSGTGSITVTADGNTELVINDTNATFSGPVVIKDRNTIVLNDTDNSNYVALRAPASVTTNNTYTFPDGYGTSGQVLSTDGAGTLSWADAGDGGGGGGSSYPNSTITTPPGTSGNYDLAEGPAQDGDETPFEAGGTDAFGVNLGSVFDAMDPIGSTASLDYGDSEAYVGA